MLPILARRVQSHVPQLVGLSMAVLQHGLTFTLASSALDIAVIDAAQYLDGGPCVDAVHRGEAIAANPGDPLDEAQWQLFSQLASARGIRSTLSLPLYDDGQLWGGLNLYAATPDAFVGHHHDLAGLLGSPPGEIVTNADLSFSSRLAAAAAPQQLRDRAQIDTAVGILAAQRRTSIDEARVHLREAAAQAGVDEVEVARVILIVRGVGDAG